MSSTFPRPCGCELERPCAEAVALKETAEMARLEFGLAEYTRLLTVWACHRIGRLEGTATLTCSVCGAEKAPEEFDRQADRRRGYRSACRACEKARKQGREEPTTLELLARSVELRTVPPLGLRDTEESQSADDLRSFPPGWSGEEEVRP